MTKKLLLFISSLILVVGIGACGGGDEPLTAQDIAEQSRPSTLQLIGKSNTVSPTSGAAGIQYYCSAWVYDAAQDLVATNAHCVTAPTILVGQSSTELLSASVVGVDNANDLAIVRVPGLPDDAVTIPLAETAPAQGDAVYVLGYPGNGKPDSLTTPYQVQEGTITALEGVTVQVGYDAFEQLWASYRVVNDNSGVTLDNLIQASASTTHGGSGGPLVNDNGEVVGVTVAGTSEGNQNDSISLETLNTVLPALANGDSNAWLGLSLSAVPSEAAHVFGADGFLLVGSITRNSAIDQQTDQARLLAYANRKGYYLAITKINGQVVETQQQLVNALAQITTGQEVRFSEYAVNFETADVVNLGTVSFTAP
jgi:S1-C subfamily serine protease